MGDTIFEGIKKRHEAFYEQALRESVVLANNKERKRAFVQAVTGLLNDMTEISGTLGTADHIWLVDAADKWRTVFSTYLNEPTDVIIYPPAQVELLAPAVKLSEDELERRQREKAQELSYIRKVKSVLHDTHAAVKRMDSSPREMQNDWRQAQVVFASQVLDGVIDFASQLTSQSYRRLEQIWLREVKQFKAYCIWEGRGGGANPWFKQSDENTDYLQACDQLRQMLVLANIKKRAAADFEEAKVYLEERYLDSQGKLDPIKAQKLRQMRAYEIWEACGDPDEYRNYMLAQTYLKLFYENIIPAVTEDDREKTLLALKAFQYCRSLGNRYRLISCFEAALVIYFLNEKIITRLWERAGEYEGTPPWVVSVKAPAWPQDFVTPAECAGSFRVGGERIFFEGVMTQAQRRVLCAELKDSEHRRAVKELFRRSRLLYANQTI